MTQETSAKPVSPAPGKRHWGRILALLVVAGCVVLWFAHPALMRKAIRLSATEAAAAEGFDLQIGNIRANLILPITVENVRLQAKNPASRTSVQLRVARLTMNSLWEIFFRSGRIFQFLQTDGLTGVLDFSTVAPPRPASGAKPPSEEAQRNTAAILLRLLPEAGKGNELNVQVLADSQVYDLHDASLSISEAQLGKLKARSVGVRAGTIQQDYGPIEAVTAWKDGSLYLGSLTLRPDLVINNFSANFVNPGAVSLRVDAQVFGGLLSGDTRLGQAGGQPYIDAAAWASNVDLSKLPTLLGLKGKASGLLREGRFTFRGNPGKAAQAEASLRLVADDFHWNDRGWKSLEIGASMTHSRLAITQFDLRQKDNLLSANGEVSIDKGWAAIPHSPLQLNINGSINQIGELAGLLGSPFDEMSGRMSLNGVLNGQADDLSGYLNMEASQVRFRKLPVDSVRLATVFKNNEAQVARLEVWSGKDSVTGDGSISLTAPHRYSGELNMAIKNIASYLAPFRAPKAESVYSGALGVQWQGDGTFTAHSGAFTIKLGDFVSAATPSGLTGQFIGTYAPNSVYLGTLELSHGPLRLFTHASVASSGITLKETELYGGKNSLLKGDLYFPIDLFALARGKTWQQCIQTDYPVYAQIASSKDISLKDLLQLTGGNFPVTGTVRGTLDASGKFDNVKLSGTLAGRGLTTKFQGASIPSTDVDITFAAGDGKADFSGALTSEGFSPAHLQASVPFGIKKTPDGAFQWLNPKGEFTATVNLPSTSLSALRPLGPKLAVLSGALSGQLTASNTLNEPHINGSLAVQGGTLQATAQSPEITKLDAIVRFDLQSAVIDHLRGEIADGAFQVSGDVNFKDIKNPAWNLTLSGQKLDLARTPDLNLHGNVELTARGNNAGGQATGTLRLVDGRVTRRLQIKPLVTTALVPNNGPILERPDTSFIPKPFSDWKLDVKVTNETPFLFTGKDASGSITPDLTLVGTPGKPIPVGQVRLSNVRIYLPLETMFIRNGRVSFFENDPWEPNLDIRGTTRMTPFEILAYAWGRLDDRRLLLRSEPPLPLEPLMVLLNTGIVPGISAGLFSSKARLHLPVQTRQEPSLSADFGWVDDLWPAQAFSDPFHFTTTYTYKFQDPR